jgi:signal transduction histidine kinase
MTASLIVGAVTVFALATIAMAWWSTLRRLAAERELAARLHRAGERLLAAASPADLYRSVQTELAAALQVEDAALFIYHQGQRALAPAAGPVLEVHAPAHPGDASLARSFLNRESIEQRDDQGRWQLILPLTLGEESAGALRLTGGDSRRLWFEPPRAEIEHLTRLVAATVLRLEHQEARLAAFRSEKLAAAGQLIEGIVEELRGVAEESPRARETVDRLVSIARGEPGDIGVVDLGLLLSDLIDVRRAEWRVRAIDARIDLEASELLTLGSAAQIEQVFRTLILHAEHQLPDNGPRELAVSAGRMARRVRAEISFSARPSSEEPSLEGSLRLCRSIVRAIGGDVRLLADAPAHCRFEVELPAVTSTEAERSAAPAADGKLRSALILDRDPAARRSFVVLLGRLGLRAVPCERVEDVLDFTEEVRFDLLFSSLEPGPAGWVSLLERTRSNVGAFVLVSEVLDAGLLRNVEERRAFWLRKPVEESELRRLLQSIAG